MRETIEFLLLGGPLMFVIGAASIVALTVFIERVWALRVERVVPPGFCAMVLRHLRAGNHAQALTVAESGEAPIAGILATGLRHAPEGRAIMREVMEDRGRRVVGELERFTGVLGTVAALSPLLGLLGTITGMIATFQRVNESVLASGQVSPGALASGIWEALLTTAAGLVVAIPALVAHKYVMSRVDRIAGRLEEVSLEALDLATLAATRSSDDAAAAPERP